MGPVSAAERLTRVRTQSSEYKAQTLVQSIYYRKTSEVLYLIINYIRADTELFSLPILPEINFQAINMDFYFLKIPYTL